MRIGHIINSVNVPEDSDLGRAQPVTFKTLLRSKSISKYKDSIEHYVVGYEGDYDHVPSGFVHLPELERSVLDVGKFNVQRKLPLIGDIFNSIDGQVDLDWIVYSNVDIAVMPYFYDYLFDHLKRVDSTRCLVINRRVVEEVPEGLLSSYYSQVGKRHPGFDCFVIPMSLISKFNLDLVCLGGNFLGRAILCNLYSFADEVKILEDSHLTFHIGDDGAWLNRVNSEFDTHNKECIYRLIDSLAKDVDNHRLEELEMVRSFLDYWDTGPPIPFLRKLRYKFTSAMRLLTSPFCNA